MKAIARLFFALTTVATLAAAPAPVDYSGKWTLDRAASKDLPRMYENVSAHKIAVSQTAGTFTVAIDISRNDGPAIQQTLDFDLTGKPTETESMIRTPDGERKIPMTLKAKRRDDGRIEVTEERKLNGPEGAMTMTTYELWDLSADGRTLTVHRKDDTPRGVREYDMVFTHPTT